MGGDRAPDGADAAGGGINGIKPALGKFEGLAGVLFPVVAKMLAAVPFTARLFSGTSSRPARIRALIDSTGSRIDAQGLDLYRRLVAREAHVAGTLSMMAQWTLDDLLAALPTITASTLFITGANDRTVPPRVARAAADRMPHATVITRAGYGHLVHEEIPEEIARICGEYLTPNEKAAGDAAAFRLSRWPGRQSASSSSSGPTLTR